MFKNSDGKGVNLLKDALLSYYNNRNTTLNMTTVDGSNYSKKIRYPISLKNIKPKLRVDDTSNL